MAAEALQESYSPVEKEIMFITELGAPGPLKFL
jgi:hypothetical protein